MLLAALLRQLVVGQLKQMVLLPVRDVHLGGVVCSVVVRDVVAPIFEALLQADREAWTVLQNTVNMLAGLLCSFQTLAIMLF